MINYIAAFIFYTLAMIGVMLVGLIIYKKTFVINKSENKGIIKIIDSYPIGPKKTLLVVKIKNEKFLIASGPEHTTFLSKLENDNLSKNVMEKKEQGQNFINRNIEMENKIKFDDNKKSHLEKLQKQFMELYEKEDEQQKSVVNKAENKHQIIRQLLEELNETKNAKARSF